QLGAPVAERERQRIERQRLPGAVESLDAGKRLGHLAAVRTGIHEKRTPDRPGNAFRVLEPGEPALDGGAFEAPPTDAGEAASELHDDPAHAAVPDEDVRAAAEQRHARADIVRRSEDVRELVDRVGYDEEVGGAADPEGGMTREWLVRSC